MEADRPFAKTFDVDGRQVLVYHGSDDDAQTPYFLSVATSIDGTRASMRHRWEDTDEDYARMYAAFDKFDQAEAERFVATMVKVAC